MGFESVIILVAQNAVKPLNLFWGLLFMVRAHKQHGNISRDNITLLIVILLTNSRYTTYGLQPKVVYYEW
jgi:hypothetical protein